MPAAQPEATPAVQFILPFTCLKNFKSCFPTHLLPEGRMITIFLFYVDSTKNTGSQSFKQKPKLFAVALVEAAAVTVANASAAGEVIYGHHNAPNRCTKNLRYLIGPAIWNSLPASIQATTNAESFRWL